MRKSIIIISLISLIVSGRVMASEVLDRLIENGHYKLTSKIMSQEIIRQLEKKEGMTIDVYMIKRYFERILKEKMK